MSLGLNYVKQKSLQPKTKPAQPLVLRIIRSFT